jgi:hypothetical protein
VRYPTVFSSVKPKPLFIQSTRLLLVKFLFVDDTNCMFPPFTKSIVSLNHYKIENGLD